MINIEHFRKKELIAIVLLALSWAAANLLFRNSFYISMALAFLIMSLLLMMTCRLGRATLSLTIGVITSMLLIQSGILNMEWLLHPALIATSIIFEITVMIISKTRIKSISLLLIIPALISSSILPWMLLLTSGATTATLGRLTMEMINMTLASLLSAVAGTLLALLIWELIKTKKFALRIMHE